MYLYFKILLSCQPINHDIFACLKQFEANSFSSLQRYFVRVLTFSYIHWVVNRSTVIFSRALKILKLTHRQPINHDIFACIKQFEAKSISIHHRCFIHVLIYSHHRVVNPSTVIFLHALKFLKLYHCQPINRNFFARIENFEAYSSPTDQPRYFCVH